MGQNSNDKKKTAENKIQDSWDKFMEVASEDLDCYLESFKSDNGGNFLRIDKLNRVSFDDLAKYKQYLEREGLSDFWLEQYIEVQRALKDIALLCEDLDDNDKEDAFYDWLKICINPKEDASYDFYFEREGLDHEEQVKEILFADQGILRGVFKRSDWQIRLRKIKTWFLKRYDWMTAARIWRNLKNNRRQQIIGFVDLLLPRLLSAILIGFFPLMGGVEMWLIPLRLSWVDIIIISAIALLIVFLYFAYECFKIADRIKAGTTLLGRALIVFLHGLLWSLISSAMLYYMFFHHFIGLENAVPDGLGCMQYINLGYFFVAFHGKVIVFFAVFALLMGVFIQVIWEEKTITEPL